MSTTTTVTVTATADGTSATRHPHRHARHPSGGRHRARHQGHLEPRSPSHPATSTNPDAILSVFGTASDAFMFTLTNQGGGRYQDERPWLDNPLSVTVKSDFGGSATATVGS